MNFIASIIGSIFKSFLQWWNSERIRDKLEEESSHRAALEDEIKGIKKASEVGREYHYIEINKEDIDGGW